MRIIDSATGELVTNWIIGTARQAVDVAFLTLHDIDFVVKTNSRESRHVGNYPPWVEVFEMPAYYVTRGAILHLVSRLSQIGRAHV